MLHDMSVYMMCAWCVNFLGHDAAHVSKQTARCALLVRGTIIYPGQVERKIRLKKAGIDLVGL